MGYIYKILYKDKPVYVGQTIKTIDERWNEHRNTALRLNKNKGYAIHAAMRKYGINNFTIESIEDINNKNLNEREKFLIKELNTHISEKGYNLTWGGETCADSIKVRCYQYDIKGNLLKEFPSISEAARSVSGAHENIIKVMQGLLNTAYGYRWSYLKIDKLDNITTKYTGAKKTIYQYDLMGNFIKSYPSSKEAARFLNKSQGNISSAANGKRKTAYGFIWSYDYIMHKAGY